MGNFRTLPFRPGWNEQLPHPCLTNCDGSRVVMPSFVPQDHYTKVLVRSTG
jgi:hypothetical protein